MNNLRWTPDAKDSYAAILQYVMDNFPLDVALKMDDKVEALLKRLEHGSTLCPLLEKLPGVRRCVITKHISLLYRAEGNDIQLLAFIDNRMNHPFLR